MRRLIRHKSKRGAIIMLLTVMTPFLLVPVAGLAIDATIIHIVQTKLQAAVDASALGAGRLLGVQGVNLQEIGCEFFNANFTVGARGFWGATLPGSTSPCTGSTNPKVDYTSGISQQITVNATADVPTLFMKIFGYNQAFVSAVGQASRRDARVIFVVDRSGSMDHNSTGQPIGYVKEWVQTFIKEFTPNLDEVGLIVFDATGVVAYPSTNTYDPTVSATAGGPDGSFWDKSSGGKSSYPEDAVYQTSKINVKGGTGMADALSLAYIELQKAHLRDLKSGADNKTNAILLFTDGVPTALSVYANDPNHSGPWVTTACTNRNNGATSPIYFWLALSGNPPFAGINISNNQLASLHIDSTFDPNWYVQWPYDKSSSPKSPEMTVASTNESGCSSSLGNVSSLSALSQIPGADKYGNKTTGGDSDVNGNTYGYKDSYWIDIDGKHQTDMVYKSKDDGNGGGYGNFNPGKITSAYHWGLAMWNATDNAALNIRTDANMTTRGDSTPMHIQILTIGYSGDGGTDAGLLKRISNDPNDTQSPNALPNSWSGQPQGKFCLGTDIPSLQACVNVMGSILLHLTK